MSEEGPHAQLLAAQAEAERLARGIDIARARRLKCDGMERDYIRLGNTIRRLLKEVAKADGRAA